MKSSEYPDKSCGVSIRSLMLIAAIFVFSFHELSAQYTSSDNFTGEWSSNSTWTGNLSPGFDINGKNVTINGFVTSGGTVYSTGSVSYLVINDTLVIHGDLYLSNNGNLTINDGGVLIVRGNVMLSNQTSISSNSFLIVSGNFSKLGPQGTFSSNDSPAPLFIGGSVLTNDANWDALKCPGSNPYPVSSCSFGNLTDLKNLYSSIYGFYTGTCLAAPFITLGEIPAICQGATSAEIQYSAKSSDADRYSIDFNSEAEAEGFADVFGTAVLPADKITITVPGLVDPGTYYGILRVNSSATDCQSTGYPVSISVLTVPGTPGIITGSAVVCSGTTGIVYSVADILYATGYLWTIPSGATITSGENTSVISISYSESALSGIIRVKGINACNPAGGPSGSDFNITVNRKPQGALTSNGSLCGGGTVQLTWTASVGSGPFSIVYNDGISDRTAEGVTSGAPFNAFINPVSATTTYTIISATDANSCSRSNGFATGTATLTVKSLPVVTISGPSAICKGSAGNVYTTEPGMTNYIWTISSGGNITAGGGTENSSVTVTWNGAGEQSISVNYTNPGNCNAEHPTVQNVAVREIPVVTSSAAGDFCSNSVLDYTITGSLEGTTFSWNRTAVTGISNTAANDQTTNPISEMPANTTDNPVNVVYQIVPALNGCTGPVFSFTATINPLPRLIINDPEPVCFPGKIDLTSGSITEGSKNGLLFTYWEDEYLTIAYPSPASAATGTYYIKGSDPSSTCFTSKPVHTVINKLPELLITDPVAVCSPLTVDITKASVTSGSTPGLEYSYWTDSQGTGKYTTPGDSKTGIYYIKGTDAKGCYVIKPVNVTVNQLPVVTITSTDAPLCTDEKRVLTATPGGGNFTVADGPGIIIENILSASGPGIVSLVYTYNNVCTKSITQVITFTEKPVPDAGPDQDLIYVSETLMAADLSENQTGEWSLQSGSGIIADINSPVTKITDLASGENIFRWKVRSGECESFADVKITVSDIFIPNVITPNGDGKNDFLIINALIDQEIGPVELIILNKWGSVEYRNLNYSNNWDGKNSKGEDLENDTYLYIIRFDDGMTRKGTVLITR